MDLANWQEKYGIQEMESKNRHEEFVGHVTLGNIPARKEDVPRIRFVHKTYRFKVQKEPPVPFEDLCDFMRLLEMCEVLRALSPGFSIPFDFPVPEGGKCPEITHTEISAFLRDDAPWIIAKMGEIEPARDGERLMFFRRKEWHAEAPEPADMPHHDLDNANATAHNYLYIYARFSAGYIPTHTTEKVIE